MYPGHWGKLTPDEPAVTMAATGDSITHAELDAASNQLAHLLRAAGLGRGDHIAVLMENHLHYLAVVWAGLRSGLQVTAINWHLTPAEAAYIVEDCEARVLISSAACAGIADPIESPHLERRLMFDRPADLSDRWEDYPQAVDEHARTPIADESAGETMLYSSGTTGRPKGVLKALPEVAPWQLSPEEQAVAARTAFGFDEHTVYLSPAPLYHAAPLGFCRRVLARGGTVVIMDRFDAAASLDAIERHQVTHSQWVPTMFSRMLDLPDSVRASYDLSTHQMAIHAAAPCPVDVKQRMMDWWGPIIWEYYSGSEGIGLTLIRPHEWLANPGSVGMATPGKVFVLDEHGDEVAAGEQGLIHFKPDIEFEYKGDRAKTAAATSHHGYVTYGDVGYVNDNGYLFLTDRKSFMIISGGVNIYPREAEDVLIQHPAVLDVGVFGIPHPDLGEEVKAAVELQPGFEPSDELAHELIEFCRERLSTFKCPRSIDFADALPRLPTGKLRKSELRGPYWPDHQDA